MSDPVEVKTQLGKAKYYYEESNTELEHVQDHAKKAGELVKEMASLLLILGADWSESAKNSQLNSNRADDITSRMEAALQVMGPLQATVVTSLASYLGDACQSAKSIKESSENSLATVTYFPLENFSDLASQMIKDAETLGQAAKLSKETQQHFMGAIAACEEYRDTF